MQIQKELTELEAAAYFVQNIMKTAQDEWTNIHKNNFKNIFKYFQE